MKTLSRGVMASPTVLSLISSALCTWHACMTLNFDLISHHKHNYLDNEHLIIRERLFVAFLVDSMHLNQLSKLWTHTIPFQQCTTGVQIVGKMYVTDQLFGRRYHVLYQVPYQAAWQWGRLSDRTQPSAEEQAESSSSL